MSDDSLGDRMKLYEMREAGRQLMPRLPVLARLDGRSFSRFTEGMERPFDARLSQLMIETTRFLVSQTQAQCGYTQSDEITLVWEDEPPLFGGRLQKLVSALAAMASVFFSKDIPLYIPAWHDKSATFDCRVWNVPNVLEATNAVLWREYDATKNSISAAARVYYSHDEVVGKCGAELQEMLWRVCVNWNDYPSFFKRGTYLQNKSCEVTKVFTEEELAQLPPRHAARTNPTVTTTRSVCRVLDMPPLAKVVNRVEVLFRGHDPVIEQATDTQGEHLGQTKNN